MDEAEGATRQATAIYIRTYLDPEGELTSADDAAAVIARLDRDFAEQGGSGVSVAAMTDYLALL